MRWSECLIDCMVLKMDCLRSTRSLLVIMRSLNIFIIDLSLLGFSLIVKYISNLY